MCSPPPRDASPTRRRSGRRWRSAICRPSRPTTRRIGSTRPANCAPAPNPNFKQIANGLPGLETAPAAAVRCDGVEGPARLEKFVDLTATAPAKIYNLHPRKGSIAIGADADIAIWDPDREVTLSGRHDA